MIGETLKEGTHLDIESELNLIRETRRELKANCSLEKAERRTMKELGLKRSDINNSIHILVCVFLLQLVLNIVKLTLSYMYE